MWWRIVAIAVLGLFSTMNGRGFLQRIQNIARQFQQVPDMVQEICDAVNQHSRFLDSAIETPLSTLSQQEKARRARVGSKQGWACKKCRHQLDNRFQVLNIREIDMAICSRCIQKSLAGQC